MGRGGAALSRVSVGRMGRSIFALEYKLPYLQFLQIVSFRFSASSS